MLALQFVEANGQVAQGAQDLDGAALGDLAAVLVEGVVTPIMRAVFDGSPMVANNLEQLLIAVLPLAQAGGVKADGVGGRLGLGAQGDAFAPHGQDLPAAAEADFFRGDGHAGQAAALKPMMAFFPGGLLFQREKKIGP